MADIDKMLYLRDVSVTVIGASGAKEIKGFRIQFDIEKTNTGDPNRAKIRIFNLADKTHGLFEEEGAKVVLKAGYLKTSGVIFQGDITKAKKKHKSKTKKLQSMATSRTIEGVDIITELECGDGDNKYRNTILHQAFPPGTKFEDALKAIANTFEYPTAIDLESLPQKQYAKGFSVEGYVKDILNNVCKTNNLEWSIQNETVQIIPKKVSDKFGTVLLNASSGLVGSPSKMTGGVEFTSLLQPALIPGRSIKLESKYINGVFKIRTVNHSGDTHDGSFISRCEATEA